MHHFCPAHEWDFRKPSLVYFEHLAGYVHILRLAIADLEELFSRRGFEAVANLSGMNQTAVQVIQSLKQKPALEQISVEGTSAFTWWALRTTEEFCLNTFSHRFKLYVSDLLSLSKDTGTPLRFMSCWERQPYRKILATLVFELLAIAALHNNQLAKGLLFGAVDAGTEANYQDGWQRIMSCTEDELADLIAQCPMVFIGGDRFEDAVDALYQPDQLRLVIPFRWLDWLSQDLSQATLEALGMNKYRMLSDAQSS